MFLEAAIALLAIAAAIFLQPWRLLASQRPLAHESQGRPSALWTPLLAALVVLPWAWALPTLHHMPLQLQWSGACLVLLTLGWPLAVPVLLALALLALAMLLTLVRLLKGPTAQDRVLALDCMYLNGMLLMLVLGIQYGSSNYFEAALLVALFGFVGSTAMAKFLLRGEVIE